MIVDAHAHIFPVLQGLGAARGVAIAPMRDEAGRLLQIRRLTADGSTHCASLQSPLAAAEGFEHTPEMLIANLDAAGVGRAVLLQGPVYGEFNGYVRDAVRRYPDRLTGAAYLDPWDSKCDTAFERIGFDGGFRAVKLEFTDAWGLRALHPGVSLNDPAIAWLWGKLEQAHLVLVLDLGSPATGSYQTATVRHIAVSYPSLRVVICHLAHPTPAAEADPELWGLWETQLALGHLSNVWFDTSSLPAYVWDEGYPYPSAARYLRMAADKIGPHKIMWGTDVPMTLEHVDYPRYVELALLHTGFLPHSEQSLILGENALRVYGSMEENGAA